MLQVFSAAKAVTLSDYGAQENLNAVKLYHIMNHGASSMKGVLSSSILQNSTLDISRHQLSGKKRNKVKR